MFCMHCGKQLEENQVCDCPKSVETAQAAAATFQPGAGQPAGAAAGFNKDAALNDVNEKFQKTAAAFSEEAKGLFKLIPPILKTPAQGIRAYMETARTATGLQLIGLKALISALLVLFALMYIESSFGGWYSIPKVKPFFMTLVVIFALDYAFSWIMYLFTAVVFKGTTTPEKMTALSGLRCLPEAAAIILGAVGCIIWVPLGLTLYVALFILGVAYLAEGYLHAAAIDENKRVYVIAATYGISVLVNMLAMQLIAGDLGSMMNPFGGLF